jgi:WD40 repeat protein
VLTSGEAGVLRWPLAGCDVGEPEVVLDGPCMRSARSPDGRWLGVVRRGAALLIDGGGEPRELGRQPGLDRVAFSPDGRWIAIGSWNGDGLHVWDTATGEPQAHLAAGEASAMGAFSPDGELLLVATFDEVSVVRTGSWQVERAFAREGPRRPSVPAAFSPDGSLVALGIGPARVRLMRVDGWETIADLEPADPRSLFHMRFLDEGSRLAVATTGHRLLIWNLGAAWEELVQRGLAEPDELGRKTK